MRKLRPHHLTPCLLSVGLICSPAILAGENFSDLFTDAKPILDLRYRYEHCMAAARRCVRITDTGANPQGGLQPSLRGCNLPYRTSTSPTLRASSTVRLA